VQTARLKINGPRCIHARDSIQAFDPHGRTGFNYAMGSILAARSNRWSKFTYSKWYAYCLNRDRWLRSNGRQRFIRSSILTLILAAPFEINGLKGPSPTSRAQAVVWAGNGGAMAAATQTRAGDHQLCFLSSYTCGRRRRAQ
jgi:hypothetical protein